MRTDVACGIDFGTSNSTVALSHGGKKTLIALEDSKTTLPSAVFFREGGPLFGRAAVSAYTGGDEGRFMRGLKKILGTSLMEESTRIGRRSVPFAEILGTFIDHLKTKAEEQAGGEVDSVVLGRPVHFHDNDPDGDNRAQATLEEIARACGFKHIEFLYEPIAAAFAHEENVAGEKLALVIDLGGGTSDFTVIRMAREKMARNDRRNDILATSGVRIGGTTFDYHLSVKSFMPWLGMGTQFRDTFDKSKLLDVPSSVYFQLSDWAMVNFAQTSKAISETLDIKRRALDEEKLAHLLKLQQNHLGHALLGEVENAKINLTEQTKYIASLKELDEDLKISVTRPAFEKAIATDVDRVFASITECLSLAGIERDKIDLIIMTGGSTELPIINAMVKEQFPRAEISQGNKLDSVGLGLAYRAANIF